MKLSAPKKLARAVLTVIAEGDHRATTTYFTMIYQAIEIVRRRAQGSEMTRVTISRDASTPSRFQPPRTNRSRAYAQGQATRLICRSKSAPTATRKLTTSMRVTRAPLRGAGLMSAISTRCGVGLPLWRDSAKSLLPAWVVGQFELGTQTVLVPLPKS